MQLEIDSLQMEIKKKETIIAVTNTEKEKTFERLHDEEGTFYIRYKTVEYGILCHLAYPFFTLSFCHSLCLFITFFKYFPAFGL